MPIRGENLIRSVRMELGQDRGFGLSVPLSDAQIIYAIKTSIAAYGRYHPRFSYQSWTASVGKSEYVPQPRVRGIRQLNMVPTTSLLPITLPEMALVGGQFISWGQALDYSVVEQYCLAPETKILKTDLSWIPIREAKIGEEIIGFDEDAVAGNRRRFKRTSIENLTTVSLPSVKMIMSNGIEITCSRDHRWLSLSPCGQNIRWRDNRTEVRSLRVGDMIYTVGKPWETEDSREAGWLAGIFDGEAWISVDTYKNRRSAILGIAQCPGMVHNLIRSLLGERGFVLSDRLTDSGDKPKTDCRSMDILGGFTERLRLVGSIRPVRLLEDSSLLWEGVSVGSSEVATIVSIEDVGVVDLIGVSTTTRTLVAEGLLSHNSIYLQWKESADVVFSNKPSYCYLPDQNKLYIYNPSSDVYVSFQGEMDWYVNQEDDLLWDTAFNDSNTVDVTDQRPSVSHPEHLDEACSLIPQDHMMNWVRRLALGESMKILGRMFSRYGSIPGVDGKDITLNGPALLQEGTELWDEILKEIRQSAIAMIPPIYR